MAALNDYCFAVILKQTAGVGSPVQSSQCVGGPIHVDHSKRKLSEVPLYNALDKCSRFRWRYFKIDLSATLVKLKLMQDRIFFRRGLTDRWFAHHWLDDLLFGSNRFSSCFFGLHTGSRHG